MVALSGLEAVTTHPNVQSVTDWIQRDMTPDEFEQIGIVQAGSAIWVVGLSAYSRIERSLRHYAEANGCSIELHIGKQPDRDYCIFS